MKKIIVMLCIGLSSCTVNRYYYVNVQNIPKAQPAQEWNNPMRFYTGSDGKLLFADTTHTVEEVVDIKSPIKKI